MTARKQAADALLSFARTGRLDDRIYYGGHWLGESPNDSGYRVQVTLSVAYDGLRKEFTVSLATGETRYESGQVSMRHEREMPVRRLGTYSATRFGAKRAETLYNEALAALRANPQPLIELLTEESDR